MQAARAFQAFTANHAACAIDKDHPPTQQGMRSDPTHRGEADKSVFFHVGRQDADLIHVGSQHDPDAAGTFLSLAGNQVSHGIHLDIIHVAGNFSSNDITNRAFKS